MHQSDTCYGQWHPYHDHGTGGCADGTYHRTYHGMYGYHCKSGWMYATAGSKKVGLDPAIMATPLISTLVDISTISVYFAIVSYVFGLN